MCPEVLIGFSPCRSREVLDPGGTGESMPLVLQQSVRLQLQSVEGFGLQAMPKRRTSNPVRGTACGAGSNCIRVWALSFGGFILGLTLTMFYILGS